MANVSATPSLRSTIASSLLPMSTTDTSKSLLLVTVGLVWPGTSSVGSSLVSMMSRPADTILRLPNPNCLSALTDISLAPSNSSSPVISSPSTRMSFTSPMTSPRWCI